jgi:hypothetical protein
MFTAAEPIRTDTDGDGYFLEADPNDSNSGAVPAPNGGCGSNYQTCSVACQASTGQVVINEVLPAPLSNGVEWVELYNTTGSTINIGYCYIDDVSGGSAPYRIPASTLIPPHGFWTLDRTSYFNNAGDDVRFLKEDSSTLLDSFSYGSTTSDLSWYRSPDGGPWASSPTASTTKGQSNGGAIFGDVPTDFWAWNFVERLYKAGITGGCGTNPITYCPDGVVTRAQMAVFLLRGIYGPTYAPPSVGSSSGFGDVSTAYWSGAWIKQLAAEGITGGCGNGNYCPEAPVTRAQMAVFLLRAKYGTGYTPPDAGGSSGFSDVAPAYWAATWIKQLAAEGITGGCGNGNYCPESPVTRAQMAVFLVRTFDLP